MRLAAWTRKLISGPILTTAACIQLLAITPAAFAQEETDVDSLDLSNLLDNIVMSVSKREETLDEAPGSVFLITRDMIERYGFETVADALAIVPGLYVNKDFTLTTVGVRGISLFGDWNSRVILLIDGRSSVELYSGTSNFDLPGISIDNLERIEVVKGPASSIYGSNAFFGTINLITRKHTNNSVQSSSVVSTATRSGDISAAFTHFWKPDFSISGSLSANGRTGSKLYFSEFDALDSTTLSLDENGSNQYYLDSADFTGGYADRRNKFKSAAGHVVVRNGNWSLTGHYVHGETGIAQSMWGSLFNKADNKFLETRGYVDLGYDAVISPKVDLTARVSYDTYEFIDHVLYNYYILEASPAYLPGPLWIDRESDRWWSGEVRLGWRPSENTRLTLGSDAKFHRVIQESGEADLDRESVAKNVITSTAASLREDVLTAYGQLDQQVGPHLKITGALQASYQSYSSNALIPKGAVVYSPRRGTALKFIASRGYRSPTMYEMSYDDGWFYIGNPDLKPEQNSNYEVVVSQKMPYGFDATVSGFASNIRDLITQTAIDSSDLSYPTTGTYDASVSQYRNGGHVHTTGIEVGVQRNPVYRLSGFASASYASLKFEGQAADVGIPNSVAWHFNAGMSYQITPHKLSGSALVKYVGSRMLWDGSKLGSTTLVDVAATYRRAFNFLSFTAGVSNLLDVDYRVPLSPDYAPSTSIGQSGRSIFVRVTAGR